MTLWLVPLPKATGLANTDARTHFHHTAHTSDDGGVDGSHSVFVSNERASSSASLSDGVSDLTTGSSSELATRKPLSSHTPATPASSGYGNQFHFIGEAEPFDKYVPAELDQDLQGIGPPEDLDRTLEEISAPYREYNFEY
jgi:hypothetical protein